MIKVRVKFANDEPREFDIEEGELLSAAVERSLSEIPTGKLSRDEYWLVVVNGYAIEGDMWKSVALKKEDTVVISPKIRDGDSAQIFKTAAIIIVTAIVATYAPELGPFWTSIAVSGAAIGMSLLLNALIPPPLPGTGEIDGYGGGVEGSQMYAISGQSNQMKRMATCPAVYGSHRMFPNIAAMPYTELSVDPETGETIQYLYVIYDFGIGTYLVSDLKIGDTPIAVTSFKDFNYNLVDPAKTSNEDDYDQALKTEFSYYRAQRHITSLAIALNDDGDTNVQNTDGNIDNIPQEIVLDLVCPHGLFGYSSNGVIGNRSIDLGVEFAPVGTSFWVPYNDLNEVSSHQVVGGIEQAEFKAWMVGADGVPDFDTSLYLELHTTEITYFGNLSLYFIKPGIQSVIMESGTYAIRSSCFDGNRFLGYVEDVDYVTFAPRVLVTLNRVITEARFDIYANELRFVSQGSGVATVTGNRSSPVYASIRFTPKLAGEYQVRVRRIRAYGDFTTSLQDGITWAALTTAYLRNPISTTIRHTFLELKIRATDQLNGNISTLSAVCASVIPVYDPDTELWTRQPSSNPAWVFADLLTGQVNKRALSRDRLHLESLVEWADYCDEIPTPPDGQTFLQPRFTSNFVLDYQATLQDVLAQVGGSAQASLNIIDGKYGVLIDKRRDTPVQVFTPRNSRDFSSTRNYSLRPDGIKVTFVDPNTDWNTNEVVVYDNGFNAETAVSLDSLTAFACTNNEQAWRFGRYMIAQNKLRQEMISILVDFEYLACTRGDYVQITQDVMEAGGTPARVKAVDIIPAFFGGTYTRITIDDSIDQIDGEDYGYVYRNADGIQTSTLSFDDGINSVQTIVFSAWPPTGGAIKFRYKGNTTASIPYTNMVSGTFLTAIRGLPNTDDVGFNLEETLGDFNGTFDIQWSNTFEHTDELEIVDNTLTYGGGDIAYESSYIVGIAPTPNEFVINDDAYTPSVGDLIVIGVVGQIVLDCIVKTISPNDDTSANIVLVEKADEIFDYESTDVLPSYDPQISITSHPDKPPKAVTNLVVSDNTWRCSALRSGLDYYVNLSWDIPNGSAYALFEIWVNDGRGYRSVGTTTSRTYSYSVDQSRLDIEHGFKVVAVSATGMKLELVAMTTITATPSTKPTPPSDVENFYVAITDQTLQLTWAPIDDCDAFQYVIRYSPDVENVTWNSSTPLATVVSAFNTFTCQARTGTYFIKAIDYAGNESPNAGVAITTIPNLFGINDISSIDEAPTFIGERIQSELLGEAVVLTEQTPGDIDTVVYYDLGYYTFAELLDLGDIYTVRLQSLLQADGLKKGELMSDWDELDLIDHLSTVVHDDWNVALEYRATTVFDAMSDWVALNAVDHINFGAGSGFTAWRDIPQVGDVTGRTFQFRVRLESLSANVTPRVFDTTVNAYMPDRFESADNLTSSASLTTTVTYATPFAGPGTTPNVQISIDNGATGDYWTFDTKTLEGFSIRFYDKNGVQVVRQFDASAKGYGHQYAAVI